MTTIADSIKGTLDAGWTAAGGAEPTYYVGEDYTTTSPPPAGKDYIWVVSTSHRTKPKAVNDVYSNITHTIDVIANTLTSADRRKEIADEIVRILDSTAITGMGWQKCGDRVVIRPEKLRGSQTEKITVTMIELLASSTSAYGANTAASYLNALLMYGSANATWVPCVFETGTAAGKTTASGQNLSNPDGTDTWWLFGLPLPTVKGTLKLYVTGLRVGIFDADAGDYVSGAYIAGQTYNGASVMILSDTTDYTAQALITYTCAATDCSSYEVLRVTLNMFCTDANDLDISSVCVRCYYA